MKFIGYAIVPLSVGLFIPIMFFLISKFNLIKESKMNSNDFCICSSAITYLIGTLSIIVFAVILILLNLFYQIDLITNIICIPLLIFFMIGLIMIIREKIVVKGKKILYTPPLGKIKIFQFEEITNIKIQVASRGIISYRIYKCEKKLFAFSNIDIGANLFMERAEKLNINIEFI